ncbi:MAG: threonine synthase, partial [Spirochaetaceae bacterium]|nr:threonine synthase [Spirochaetaceae bacterium]
SKRGPADPAVPSNLERLESLFETSPAVMKGLVFPAEVSAEDRKAAARRLFVDYNIMVSPQTADAYAAAVKRTEMIEEDGGVVVLISRDHPAFSSDNIRQMCGEAPAMPSHIASVLKKIEPEKRIEPEKDAVVSILKELKS